MVMQSLSNENYLLTECPLWSAIEQILYWVDIKAKRIYRHDPKIDSTTHFELPEEIGCLGLCEEGGFIAGLRSGLWLLDDKGRLQRMIAANPENQSYSRFNDGRTDPAGRFMVGTIDEQKLAQRACLYRYDRRGLHVLLQGLTTSNGLAFSPDGTLLYHADTAAFTVRRYKYDLASGEIDGGQVFIQWDPWSHDRARPDGAAVDSEGCYWIALYEGGRIERYDPKGVLIAKYAVPVRCPTMLAFGGRDFRTLFVTSARHARSPEEVAQFPLSGNVFAMPTEVTGFAEPLFKSDV
jgi:sugar lactone lactonase YvrE